MSDSPTGGTKTTNGTKTVHTFTTSDNFVVPSGMSGYVEVLIVGGGGAGRGVGAAGNSGDGGSAGSITYNNNYFVSEGTYVVTVGAGGVGVSNAPGGNGGQSAFGALTANGGTGGQNASSTSVRVGGAGAGGAGGSGVYPTAGEGGVGLAYSITGSSVYYAGGGGGGFSNGGAGGNGGGGRGESYNSGNAAAGTANTGGGGGGVSNSLAQAGKNGGSGIVIVSYVTADFILDTPSSAYDVLMEVGNSLRNLIWKYVSDDPVLKVDITSADIIHAHPASTDKGKLCIFLYRIEEDPYQNDLPWDDDGTSASIGKPPLTLNLYYMIAPRYDTTLVDHILKDHLLLGKVMQIFYDNPVLRSPDLQGSLANETFNVRLESPSLDEINKIWAMPDTNRYMIAAYYQVSPLRLNSSRSMAVKRVATFIPQMKYKVG